MTREDEELVDDYVRIFSPQQCSTLAKWSSFKRMNNLVHRPVRAYALLAAQMLRCGLKVSSILTYLQTIRMGQRLESSDTATVAMMVKIADCF